MKKIKNTIFALTLGFVSIFGVTALSQGVAHADSCVNALYTPTRASQMTSFSVNTGLIPVNIWWNVGIRVYTFINTYEGPAIIGWVPEWAVSNDAVYGGQDLVIVSQFQVSYAYGC